MIFQEGKGDHGTSGGKFKPSPVVVKDSDHGYVHAFAMK